MTRMFCTKQWFPVGFPTRKNDTFLHDHERFAAKILSTLTVTDDDAVMQNWALQNQKQRTNPICKQLYSFNLAWHHLLCRKPRLRCRFLVKRKKNPSSYVREKRGQKMRKRAENVKNHCCTDYGRNLHLWVPWLIPKESMHGKTVRPPFCEHGIPCVARISCPSLQK